MATHHKCADCGCYYPEVGQVSGAHFDRNGVICFGVAEVCECGHAASAHYNTRFEKFRQGLVKRQPCHHLGRHDMRCPCKDFKPKASEVVNG